MILISLNVVTTEYPKYFVLFLLLWNFIIMVLIYQRTKKCDVWHLVWHPARRILSNISLQYAVLTTACPMTDSKYKMSLIKQNGDGHLHLCHLVFDHGVACGPADVPGRQARQWSPLRSPNVPRSPSWTPRWRCALQHPTSLTYTPLPRGVPVIPSSWISLSNNIWLDLFWGTYTPAFIRVAISL